MRPVTATMTQNANLFPQTKAAEQKPLTSRIYDKCEKFWSYGGKITLSSRSYLNAAARSKTFLRHASKDFPKHVSTFATYSKLTSIIGVPFGIVDIKELSKKIFRGLQIGDTEGVALNSLTFTVIATDIFDSITTFVNTTLVIASKAPVALFSVLGLPAGFVMTGISTISRTISMTKTTLTFRKIHPDVMQGTDKVMLNRLLEEKLGLSEMSDLIESIKSAPLDPVLLDKLDKLKEKKQAKLERALPKEALKEFKIICDLLDQNKETPLTDEELSKVVHAFTHIEQHLRKKLLLDCVSMLSNFMLIASLVLFAVGAATPVPYALMGLAFTTKLIPLILQNQKVNLTPF